MGVGVEFSLFLDVSFSVSLHASTSLPLASPPPHLPCLHPPSITSMQPYYHRDSFPEFLLSLLSNWRPSARKRPAVSYGCSELVRASSVCASSFLGVLLSPPLHATSLLSVTTPTPLCVISHWHGPKIRDNITVLL